MKTAFSALTSAATGIRTNLRALDDTAQAVASASVTREEPTELAGALVEAAIQQRALEASASALRRVDETIGAIIDAFA